MEITQELIYYLEDLSRLKLKEEEKIRIQKDLSSILSYMDKLNEQNTEGVEPSSHAIPMVNVFREERAQNVYCLIDKGRTMQSAFEGMTLLDYSINASLALSHTTILKGDKTGLLTFEKQFETIIPASRYSGQMHHIQEALYAQTTNFKESDFSSLYQCICKNIGNRSLLIIFTNFDSVPAMQRQLNYLAMIAKKHSILVVFFENTEIKELSQQQPKTKEEAYETVIAEKMMYEKTLIVNKLRQKNILSLLCHPNNLTIDVINKYLEIKSRGDLAF